jgi:hypothetical protein
VVLEEKDLNLLHELGLEVFDSHSALEEKIRGLNMRQLDRLKLMLRRVEKNGRIFPVATTRGIENNEFGTFAEAVLILKAILRKKHN